MAPTSLPAVPAKHQDFVKYIQSNPDTAIGNLVKPYNDYDTVLRRIFAQEPEHPVSLDNQANVVALYDRTGSADIPVRARDLSSEPPEITGKYILPLKPDNRRPNGSPAVVSNLAEFQNNFGLFTERSLVDIDWSNVVVAGSAVVTCLLPVPDEYRDSKRTLRDFYHEKFAPASDVDLFLYGLTEEQAIDKIKHIEDRIKNSILYETTTVRTKNTITIVSQYPTRHVQIVLRIYKSIAEILTGFDVDCSCAAYDGKQVYVAPRALASYITQTNQIDLTRRSPSYENRLSKYSHRGFEVFWPGLDRSRIDPTIFERSFTRTVGLARLLVFEQLPNSSDREKYIQQRRAERARPPQRPRWTRGFPGNIKNYWEDEAPEWLEDDTISDYHTFTIPYGPRIHARKVERLLYTKDLLLNAEWNRPKDRDVNLHRHPAFFGDPEDVIRDCCGYCPQPSTDEEKQIAEEESKIYISGDVAFIKDDPGRQEIGSFKPITETDWTEMAYVGNTERLCRAIVALDLDEVKSWCAQEGSDPNVRDYTGRTPLHLACMTSTPEIVQCLVDQGARLISRLADGRTALHLAAARGNVDIVRIILIKSSQNEDDEHRKHRKKDHVKDSEMSEAPDGTHNDGDVDMSEPSDDEKSNTSGEIGVHSSTTGSFVKVDKLKISDDNVLDEAGELEPDIYDVNAIAWDSHTSPVHTAILGGHVDVVEVLVSSFGADVMLPIKLVDAFYAGPESAILILVLALQLPLNQAKIMTSKLLELGASPAQADLGNRTPFHYLAAYGLTDLLDIYTDLNRPGVKRAINHLVLTGWARRPNVHSAFTTAIDEGNAIGAIKLLDAGAEPTIEFETFMKPAKAKYNMLPTLSTDTNFLLFRQNIMQPVIAAIRSELPTVVLDMINRGVDPNTLTPPGYALVTPSPKGDEWFSSELVSIQRNTPKGSSLLDCVRLKLIQLRAYKGERFLEEPPTLLDPDDNTYLCRLEDGSYKKWIGQRMLKEARKNDEEQQRLYDERKQESRNRRGLDEKMASMRNLTREYEELEKVLLEKGAKGFEELYPDHRPPPQGQRPTTIQTPEKPEPWKVTFNFKVPDISGLKGEGYLRLFEAAWADDIDTIQALTLARWGPENVEMPLQISVQDNESLTPFSICVTRGHLETAKAILHIVEAQHKPDERANNQRYRIDSDMEDDSGAETSDEDINIRAESTGDQFTIDNIGEVATEVQCAIKPLDVLESSVPAPEGLSELGQISPIRYAIYNNDLSLLTFLLDLGQELTARDSPDEHTIYTVPEVDFSLAVSLGHLRCATELIRRTGSGLPIDDLLQQSGVPIQTKAKYYQGLSIRGKKRPDWADAGRGRVSAYQTNTPPLLRAALRGNLEVTEWFLGTAPRRYYLEFTKAHESDERVRALKASKTGLEGSILKWLTMRSHIVLHCAIAATPSEQSERLVQHLVDEYASDLLESKSAQGYTPLQMAVACHRTNCVRILINAGADQTVRDRIGCNLMHLALQKLDTRRNDNLGMVKDIIDLLDPRLITSMLTERSSDHPGSVTPISEFMHSRSWHGSYYSRYAETFPDYKMDSAAFGDANIIQFLLSLAESTGQKHLEFLNGAGNTPMHDAIKQCRLRALGMMIDVRPDLLHREDATGRTPFELAKDLWVRQVTSEPPPINFRNWEGDQDHHTAVYQSPESFLEDSEDKIVNVAQTIWELCRERGQTGHKRRLVTLFEANEVANRLAARQHGGNSDRIVRPGEETDEVWTYIARGSFFNFAYSDPRRMHLYC